MTRSIANARKWMLKSIKSLTILIKSVSAGRMRTRMSMVTSKTDMREIQLMVRLMLLNQHHNQLLRRKETQFMRQNKYWSQNRVRRLAQNKTMRVMTSPPRKRNDKGKIA